jgi:quercetin dioxygenase-like cupin family protein
VTDSPDQAIVDLFGAPRTPTAAHTGDGLVDVVRPLEGDDFETDLMFVDYVVMAPGTSIGYHRHGDDEELYLLLEGIGTMTIEGEEHTVGAGDLVLNRRGWSHGLRNDSDGPIRLVVWQVAYRTGSD